MAIEERLDRPSGAVPFELGNWQVLPDQNRLVHGEDEIRLEPKVMDLLVCLHSHSPDTLSQDDLLEKVWHGVFVTESSLHRAISKLRKALDEKEELRGLVETVPKRGYRLALSPEPSNGLIGGHLETIQILPAPPPPFLAPQSAPRVTPSRGWAWLVAAVVCVAVAGAAGLWWMNQQPIEIATTLPKIQRITPVASIPGEAVSVDFSPDGSQFVYSWTKDSATNPDLYRGGKGEPTRITSNPGSDLNPAWSPQGDLIAFARVTDGNICKLMVVQADGFGERAITDCRGGLGVYPAWSPDGKSIVFSNAIEKVGPRLLFRVDVATGEISPLTSAEGQYSDNHPAFAPDGRSLGFVRYRSTGSADLHVIELGNGKLRRLTNDNVIFGDIAWAADGRAIYFTSNRTGSFGLSWVAATGGDAALALPGAVNTDAIGVTGDGKRLLFELERLQSWIQTVPLGTGVAPTMISTVEAQDWHPSASPDGSQIAFVSNRGGSTEIWVTSRSEGSTPRSVTKFGGPHMTMPSWSPDGSKLAFGANTDGNPDIYLLELATQQLTRLTTSPAGDRDPVWTQDGRFLYFSSDRTGRHEVWRLNLENSQAEQITDTGALRPQLSSDGKWLYYINYTPRTLMRRPMDGSAPAQELGNIRLQFDRLNWSVTDALYVVDPDMQDGAIMRVDPETGASDRVASLEQFMMSSASFSVARDGSFAVVSATLVLRTDIMVADGEFGGPR